MNSHLTQDYFELLDQEDRLAHFRDEFYLPDGAAYFDGNSLGALPKATIAHMQKVVTREWGHDLIKSWNTADWVNAPTRIGDKLGKIIGALAGETVVCDSTSVNLFKALSMALQANPERHTIISEASNFPTDLYIAQGLIEQLGGKHELKLLPDDATQQDVIDLMNDDTAVLMLTQVNYRSGAMWNMAEINAAARQKGVITLWDLAHSAGAVPVKLNETQTDFAVGCGYKYLNGGPGAPAYLFAASKWHGKVRNPITGWFGHVTPFTFEKEYSAAKTITQAQCGTPQILGISALESGLDLFLKADIQLIREKSLALSSLFMRLMDERLEGFGFTLTTPREKERRGSQVCYQHANAWPISQALIADHIIGDFRAPDILRLGFAPLYNSYCDVWRAVTSLEKIMREEIWTHAQFQQKNAVT